MTTRDDVLRRFGSPESIGTKMVNQERLEMISYAFASVGAGALVEGVTPARAMAFPFFNGVLVGHESASSYKEDHTDFDESRAKDIVKGETTRDQVVRVLGAPHGEYAWPLVKGRRDRGIVYVYSHVRDGLAPRLYEKILIVSVDSNDVVTDVNFQSSGQR